MAKAPETRACVVCGKKVTRQKFSSAPDRTVCSKSHAGHIGSRPRKYESEAESFWAKVDKTGDCWLWTAGKNTCTHHGLFKFRGKGTVQAHRWAYVDAYGNIPDGFQINHSCNNPGCVRPEHLYAGTQADNVRDMLRAGRHGWRGKPLGKDKVLQIVARYQAGEGVPTLADEYGVSRNAIFNIVGGRTWSRVTGIPYAGRCERFQRVSAPAPN